MDISFHNTTIDRDSLEMVAQNDAEVAFLNRIYAAYVNNRISFRQSGNPGFLPHILYLDSDLVSPVAPPPPAPPTP